VSDSYTQKHSLYYSLGLVEVEVQLLGLVVVVLLDGQSNLADFTLDPIVQPAIIEDKFHVVAEFLDLLIFVVLELLSDCAKVHWLLHDQVVVWDLEGLHVHWVTEDV